MSYSACPSTSLSKTQNEKKIRDNLRFRLRIRVIRVQLHAYTNSQYISKIASFLARTQLTFEIGIWNFKIGFFKF